MGGLWRWAGFGGGGAWEVGRGLGGEVEGRARRGSGWGEQVRRRVGREQERYPF